MRQFCNQDHFVDQNVSHLDRDLLLLLACQISGRDGVVLCRFIKDALMFSSIMFDHYLTTGRMYSSPLKPFDSFAPKNHT